MPAKITQAIPSQNYELVCVRIAQILAEELTNQHTLTGDADLDAGVWQERVVKFDDNDLPAISVGMGRGDYDNEDATQSDGTYLFYVDAFVHAQNTGDTSDVTAFVRADKAAALKLHKLLGKCRAILKSPYYRNLGYAPPFLCNITVRSISTGNPDAETVHTNMAGRLEVVVRCPETVELMEPVVLDTYATTVKLYETEKGYRWGPDDGSPPTEPDPIIPEITDGDDYLIPETDNDMGAVKISTFEQAPAVSEISMFTGLQNIGTEQDPVYKNYNYTPQQLAAYFAEQSKKLIIASADGADLQDAWFAGKQIQALMTNNQILLRNVDFAQNGVDQDEDTLVGIGDVKFSENQKILALA